MVLGGWRILSYSLTPLHFVTVAGFNAVSGYVVGGGLLLCGVVSWALPAQRYTFGIIGMLLAVVSLVASNLGGFLVGMLFGVVGSSMTLGWGVKKPRRRDRRAAESVA